MDLDLNSESLNNLEENNIQSTSWMPNKSSSPTTTDLSNMSVVRFDIKSVYVSIIPLSLQWQAASLERHPLGNYIESGYLNQLPAGWHRSSERYARKMSNAIDLEETLEDWEEDLVWTETLLLTGLPEQTFTHLAHAWGQKTNFHFSVATKKFQRFL